MLIYEALRKDHDALKPLLDQLVGLGDSDDQEARRALLAKIRDELLPHSRAEEAVFYNSLRSIPGCKEIVANSYVEHSDAEGMLRTLQGMEFVNMDFTKLARKFRQELLHHISDEEGRIFASARQVLIDEEARQMAQAFEQLKPEVREESFVQTTIDLVANLMPNRFVAPLRSFTHKL